MEKQDTDISIDQMKSLNAFFFKRNMRSDVQKHPSATFICKWH